MQFEETIQRILSSRQELTREEVLRMIDEKERDAKGFFTRESAARAVAAELGVEPARVSFAHRVSIGSLVSGLGDVTITGRVIFVSSPRKFVRSDGEEGRLRSLFVADKTGEMRVVLWDEKADLSDPVNLMGSVVRFSHGYVRRGYDGRLELNIGSRGNLEAAPPNFSQDDFPPITSFFRKIGEITISEETVKVLGEVRQIFPLSTFKRENGSEGKVRRLELQDHSGIIMVVFWNAKADELADVQTNVYLGILGAKVRKSPDGYLELHVGASTDTTIMEKLPAGFEEI